MKTDRFSDSIRRKLESIRPEFTDKDWTRMQATLHQAGFPQPDPGVTSNPFSGGVWHSNPWLLAAASISTVALITVGIWQRSEINHLRQTVSQLKQKVTTTQVVPVSPPSDHSALTQSTGSSSAVKTQRLPTVPELSPESISSEQRTASPPRDTAYSDRYATTPAPSRLDREQENASQPLTKPADKGYAMTRRPSTSTTDSPRQQTNLTNHPKNDTYDISSTPLSTAKPILTKSNQSIALNQSIRQSTGSNRLRDKPVRGQRYVDTYSPTQSTKSVVEQAVQTTPQPVSTVETVNGVSANYESITSRPLSAKSLNWNALLARQAAKRMRPSHPATSVIEQAPTTQPESQVTHKALRFRVGVGTEVASHLWSNGVFAETVIGHHWLLGVGLNQTAYKATFNDELDFKLRTRREFFNDFPPRTDPKPDIRNINEQTTRLQIPIYLGYRVPISQAVAFIPTVNTYLNLNSTENATYYSAIPGLPPGYGDFVDRSIDRQVSLINNLALATGFEWQHKHWVAQASPVLTLPFQATTKPIQPELNWQQNVTLGLRARVLYQF